MSTKKPSAKPSLTFCVIDYRRKLQTHSNQKDANTLSKAKLVLTDQIVKKSVNNICDYKGAELQNVSRGIMYLRELKAKVADIKKKQILKSLEKKKKLN